MEELETDSNQFDNFGFILIESSQYARFTSFVAVYFSFSCKSIIS